MRGARVLLRRRTALEAGGAEDVGVAADCEAGSLDVHVGAGGKRDPAELAGTAA